MKEVLEVFLWIAVPLGVILSLRWAKGCWGEAMIATIIAPIAIAALWAIIMIVMSIFVSFVVGLLFPSGRYDQSFVGSIVTWSSGAIVVGLYVLYCIQARHGSALNSGPVLTGRADRGSGGSAKGAWRNESVKVFRRKF